MPADDSPSGAIRELRVSGPDSGDATLAVVVASNRKLSLVRACLDSLSPQCEALGATLIVVRADDPDRAALYRDYSRVTWVDAAAGDDIPRLRGRGLAASRAHMTALTEDHCVPASDWLARIALHSNCSANVIGGGMGNLQRRVIAWGAYFSEYGFFDASRPALPQSDGVTPLLTGANVVYCDSVRATVAEWMLAGDWENTVHGRLAASGFQLLFDRTIVVSQNNTYNFADFCADRFEHGFDYAQARTRDSTLGTRVVRAVTTPVLPFVLTWRVAGAAARGHASAFAKALPATFAFLTAWSVGEAAGYLSGSASTRVQQ